MSRPKVVILGAGYGGLMTSKKLERLLKSGEADVTLINKHDYHYLTTQLHKIGAGTAPDHQISMNINELINPEKTTFKKGTVSSINFENQTVLLESGETIPYDYLLIALGFEVATYGIPGIKENAFEIRSYRSTKILYRHIEEQFLLYKKDRDPSRLTFVVAGGGFTGIEMLGELIDGLKVLSKKYEISYDDVKIVLVEAAQSLLPFFDKPAVEYATKFLEKHHIQLLTKTKLLNCTPDKIILEPNRELPTKTLIWSCGVQANSLLKNFGLPLERGKLPVDSYLRVTGKNNVFCIGDCSLFHKSETKFLPPTAQVALQQADACAKNIAALIRNESLKPFEYHHKGTVASLGNLAAVGKVGPVRITGLFAAFMKQVIEARYLLILGGPKLFFKQHFSSDRKQTKVSVNQ